MFGITPLEPETIPGTYDTYKASADNLLKNYEYNKAIVYYTKALSLSPDDRICLVCRSRCHLMLGDNVKALKDAESSLAEDKLYYKGMFQKAEALFNQGDFEMALVFYHRGHNVRPELHSFRQGIKKAQQAIYNCVGTPERVKLNTTGDLSFFKKQDKKKTRNKGALCTQKQEKIVKRVRTTEKPTNERTIKQMLGDLYGDRIYLEKILKEMDHTSKTGNNVRKIAQAGLASLDKRSELWQQVKPIYARKYEARLALNRMKASRISTHDYILIDLNRIDTLMVEGNFDNALERAKKLLTLLEGYNETQLPSKMMFTSNVHSAIGSACYELDNYETAEKHHLLDLSIAEEYFIEDAERRALDNLGRVYAKSEKFQKAIDVWEKRLLMTRQPFEVTWLCHELGRCYLSMGEFTKAKEYGQRSLLAAQEGKDDRWQLHALVLIAQAEGLAINTRFMKQTLNPRDLKSSRDHKASHTFICYIVKSTRLSSAMSTFQKALKLASLLKDSEAQTVISKAMDRVNVKMTIRENDLWNL